jgi:asparagine synthase (glutamine-hydrolysing)
MWAISVWDDNNKRLYISRDKFGEKPLFYLRKKNSIFFGSQINQIKILSNIKTPIDKEKIKSFLLAGYKSVFKDNKSFFKEIKSVKPGYTYVFEKNNLSKFKNWNLNYRPNSKLKIDDIIQHSRELLVNSVKKQLNADRSVSILLSGGIDSAGIASIAHKVLNKKITTYSIISNDIRYNESQNIDIIKKDLNCKNIKINTNEIKKNDLLKELIKNIKYNSRPVLTLSSFVSSFLYRVIAKDGHKVTLSGVGADEIYAGYYDHQLYYLNTQKKNKNFKEYLKNWEKDIKPFTRNPFLKNQNYILNNKNFRKYIYFTNPKLKNFFKKKIKLKFTEKYFCSDVLRNRMLNELFFEIVPKILQEDDGNSMNNSLENRSPYLDKSLSEFLYTVPTKFLIKDGYNKFILRETLKGICSETILQDKKKVGFNVGFNEVFNLNKKNEVKDILLDTNSDIYDFINISDIKKLLGKKNFLNSESKFMFDFLNCKLFMDLN